MAQVVDAHLVEPGSLAHPLPGFLQGHQVVALQRSNRDRAQRQQNVPVDRMVALNLSARPAVLRDVFVQEPLGQLRYRGRQPLVFLFPVQVPAVGDHLAARALAFSKGNASQHPIWTRMVQPRRNIWATWCLSPFGQNRIPKP